jgi:hypothetical protein
MGEARRTSRFCRHSASGVIIRPYDSSAFPLPSTILGPTIDAPGSSRMAAISRSIAPSGTTVSLLSSNTSSLSVRRMAALFADAKPTFEFSAMTVT